MTADEVLSTMEYGDEESQDVCVIDAESRTISVPDRYATLGVESDEKGKRLCFVCPAVVGDNISLLDCSLRIIYRNGNRESAPPYLIDDAMQNGNNIEFSWLLSRKVTAYKGKVSFIFCAVKADPETGLINNEWNTTLATATVLEGLEADQHDLEESREDILSQLLAITRADIDTAVRNAFSAYEGGKDGATFTPAVSEEGILSWTNDKELENPDPVNIKGPAGEPGEDGADGKSAYEYAKDGGYTGTEAEFAAKLAEESYTKKEIDEEVTQLKGDLTQHKGDSTSHVTATEKETWNNKSNFSGNYSDLSGKPTIPTKTSQLTNDSGYAKSSDLAFDPSTYNIPVLYLTGDTTGMSKDDEVTLNWVYGENSGSCTMKWQGSSSLAYEKKNYTIKLDTAIEVVEGWGSQKKYCLKANYIDHTHARNLVSAKLWGQIVASRSPKNTTLASCPNYGAVDGFPIAIMLNGEFHGLYTWNIPKDMWTFNMGSGTQEAVICANYHTAAVNLRVHAKVDGSDHELEEVTDENNATWVVTSLNNVIDMLVDSYGADLDTTIANYLDWESAIDYYIFTVIMDGRDMVWKNYIMVTWDGTKWVFSAYDMDSTYGLDWNGATLLPPHEGITFEVFRSNRAMELIYRFKTNALKARYKQLRESVLSEYSIGLAFETFGANIPSRLLDEDAKKWTSLPSTSVNTTDQILRWVHHRLAIVDKWIEEFPVQETPVAPSAREGNVVSSSIDSTGAAYNGIGYKDGYTINNASDGTESEVAMDGCCISGFIPVTKDNIIKVTTDHWNISPNNSRIIFYDFDFKPMAYYTQHGFVGLFNGYTNKTAIQAKDKQSVTYGSDGMTTLNIAYGANCTNLAYIRIRGVGNGANLVVIREGEIPEHAPEAEPEVVVENWIPVSTDESGAIYNGTGYKDNTRTATDTPDTEEAKTGMFQTGFIPFKMTDVLRVSSASWGTSPSNAKVLICNAEFKAMAHYTANGYVSSFNDYTTGAESNVTSLKAKGFQSVTVGDDGFTTINLVYGNECTDVAYLRYTGCGSGANAVVKIN